LWESEEGGDVMTWRSFVKKVVEIIDKEVDLLKRLNKWNTDIEFDVEDAFEQGSVDRRVHRRIVLELCGPKVQEIGVMIRILSDLRDYILKLPGR
jgi:uncharacterized protein YqgV (UPF0045/DUF77 family)